MVGKIDLNAPIRTEKKEEPVVAEKEIVEKKPEVKTEPKGRSKAKPEPVEPEVKPEPVKEVVKAG